jgi:uncharacterized protein
MTSVSYFDAHMEALKALCHRYDVERLYVFGSVLTDRFNEAHSDVDLIVELAPMPPVQKGETLMGFWDAVEALFGRRFDLLTDQPVRNPVLKKELDQTRRLIYDRAVREIPV